MVFGMARDQYKSLTYNQLLTQHNIWRISTYNSYFCSFCSKNVTTKDSYILYNFITDDGCFIFCNEGCANLWILKKM